MAKVGKRIWREVEELQSSAFIGDMVEHMTDEAALRTAMASVSWHRQCIKALDQIIADAGRETSQNSTPRT